MLKTITIQEVGKRPTLDKLPILLQKPVETATNYLCIAAVELQQTSDLTYITFYFDEDLQMEVNTILEIFQLFNYRITFMNFNQAQRYLKLAVAPGKSLLN